MGLPDKSGTRKIQMCTEGGILSVFERWALIFSPLISVQSHRYSCLQYMQNASEGTLVLNRASGDVRKIKSLLHLSRAGLPRKQPLRREREAAGWCSWGQHGDR